jgi:hypothetical protein
MRFLCLCYYDQAKFDALSESDRQALGDLCPPHDEALSASGRAGTMRRILIPLA